MLQGLTPPVSPLSPGYGFDAVHGGGEDDDDVAGALSGLGGPLPPPPPPPQMDLPQSPTGPLSPAMTDWGAGGSAGRHSLDGVGAAMFGDDLNANFANPLNSFHPFNN